MKKFMKVMLILAAVLGILGVGIATAGAAMGGVQLTGEVLAATRDSLISARPTGENLWVRLGHTIDRLDDDDDDDDDWDEEYDDDDDWSNGKGHGGKQRHSSVDGTVVEPVSVDENGTRTYELEDVHELEIDLEYDSLILEQGDYEGIQVLVENDEEQNVTVAMDRDCLEIVGSFLEDARIITVRYPEGTKLRSAEIFMGTGEAEVRDELFADEMELTVGTGTIESAALLTARELDVSVGVGSAGLELVDAQEISADCGVGELSMGLSGTETDYNCEMEVGMGTVLLGEEEYASIAGEHQVNNQASRNLELECGMGTMTITFEEQ